MIDCERAVAEIDLDAVEENIQAIQALIGPQAKVMGVIKADAYGHGALEVAKVLEENGVERFAVALPDEGIELRKGGIEAPILSLGYAPIQKAQDMIQYDIAQTIFSVQSAEVLSQAAQSIGKKAKVHIKIDTGMGRIGFLPGPQAVEEIVKISTLPFLELEGIFTHFAAADELEKDFTYQQKEKFESMVEALKKRGVCFPVVHAANSAGLMDFDCLKFDCVRAGIILYGLYPSDEVKKDRLQLKPVMSVRSVVSFVKEVPAGTPISYGRTFVTKRKSMIATVPIGYADGYVRGMQQGGRMIVRGCYAPIVGRVCMDQCMIDVTDIPQVKIGDLVTVIGKDGEAEVTCDEVAEVLNTINYEIVCMIGRRVPRKYYRHGKKQATKYFAPNME
ncbi:MAG: alanine racemase [Clostridiales bacterium]|nr:alanine racemase [Clostridiales bacterium]